MRCDFLSHSSFIFRGCELISFRCDCLTWIILFYTVPHVYSSSGNSPLKVTSTGFCTWDRTLFRCELQVMDFIFYLELRKHSDWKMARGNDVFQSVPLTVVRVHCGAFLSSPRLNYIIVKKFLMRHGEN